ncbi:hypothetical protein B9Z65_4861 [Elsinoe australis]|uniref:Uncharacterized protein n=1 Tax=Elsinoe australis TaxID=40998 RepID=A0A2P8A6B2_9PEZI|nr:hypothetical protein B9Z65_4861 [Elsinoe australis]
MTSPMVLVQCSVQQVHRVPNPFVIRNMNARHEYVKDTNRDGRYIACWHVWIYVEPTVRGSDLPYRGYLEFRLALTAYEFPPNALMCKPDENFYMRTWPDGRIAAGAYMEHSNGHEYFYFGLARVVPHVGHPQDVVEQNLTRDLPDLIFRKWYMGCGRGNVDKNQFVLSIFRRIDGEPHLWNDGVPVRQPLQWNRAGAQ